jgi:hypothetical protein
MMKCFTVMIGGVGDLTDAWALRLGLSLNHQRSRGRGVRCVRSLLCWFRIPTWLWGERETTTTRETDAWEMWSRSRREGLLPRELPLSGGDWRYAGRTLADTVIWRQFFLFFHHLGTHALRSPAVHTWRHCTLASSHTASQPSQHAGAPRQGSFPLIMWLMHGARLARTAHACALPVCRRWLTWFRLRPVNHFHFRLFTCVSQSKPAVFFARVLSYCFPYYVLPSS